MIYSQNWNYSHPRGLRFSTIEELSANVTQYDRSTWITNWRASKTFRNVEKHSFDCGMGRFIIDTTHATDFRRCLTSNSLHFHVWFLVQVHDSTWHTFFLCILTMRIFYYLKRIENNFIQYGRVREITTYNPDVVYYFCDNSLGGANELSVYRDVFRYLKWIIFLGWVEANFTELILHHRCKFPFLFFFSWKIWLISNQNLGKTYYAVMFTHRILSGRWALMRTSIWGTIFYTAYCPPK